MRSGDASKRRVRRSVRSSTAAAMVFSLGWIGFGWFRCGPLQEGVELVELLLPEAAIELDPIRRRPKTLAAQLAAPPLGLGVSLDQAGVGQYLEMPRHRRHRHVEGVCQV